jgi:alpha-1,2-mannosyltransferase
MALIERFQIRTKWTMTIIRISLIALGAILVYLQTVMALVAFCPPAGPVDFFQEWSSGREVLAGRPAYPDLREATPRLLGVPPDSSEQPVLVNAHPPVAILLSLPFACLSYSTAVEIWRALSFGLIFACTLAIKRELGHLPAAIRLPYLVPAFLLLTSGPVALTIFQGQLHAVLLAIIVGAWCADRAGREQIAGALLGLAGAIKLSPILLLGYFLIRYRWRAVCAGVLVFVAANALVFFILGPSIFSEYLAVLPQVAPHRSNLANAALPGFWAKLFNPAPGRVIAPLVQSQGIDLLGTCTSIATITILAAVAIRRASARGHKDLAFGVAVIALLLVGPLIWEHTLLVLVLPLGILAHGWAAWGKPRRTLFLSTVVAVWLIPYTFRIIALKIHCAPLPPWITVTFLSYQCYALLILFALSITMRDSLVRAGSEELLPVRCSPPPFATEVQR